MAKKKRKPKATKADPWESPPDVFWIRPDGKLFWVLGHWTDMKAHPERYGLHEGPEDQEDIDNAFGALMQEGWVRGRFSDGTFYFQVEKPRSAPLSWAHELVLRYAKDAKSVQIDFAEPSYGYLSDELSAKDFMEINFPKRWGLGRPRF